MKYISVEKVNNVTAIFTPKSRYVIMHTPSDSTTNLSVATIGYLMGMLALKTYLRGDYPPIDTTENKPPLDLMTHIFRITNTNINHNQIANKDNKYQVNPYLDERWKQNLYWTVKNGKFMMFYGKNYATSSNNIKYEILYEQDKIDISQWNVSAVRNASHLFNCPLIIKEYETNDIDINDVINIENWDVSNVENMECMFIHCKTFNKPLNSWNVSNVTNMSSMFEFASSFNQPLDNWNVINVKDMYRMFYYCENFNQPLNAWGEKLKNVIVMWSMFTNCSKFNQPLNNWNVSNVEDMKNMFFLCEKFNQPLNSWGDKLKKVTDMSHMFAGCAKFNQPLDKWRLPNCKSVEGMFQGCVSFNEKIPTILKQNANKTNWLNGTKLESELESESESESQSVMSKNKTKKNKTKNKKSNQSRKNVTENDDVDEEATEIKPDNEKVVDEKVVDDEEEPIIEKDMQLESMEPNNNPNEQNGFRFIYDIFQKFYKNEKNLIESKKPKTSYFYNNENQLYQSYNDKFIEIPAFNNNTTNKRLYVKYIQYLQEEHILFTILKTKDTVVYDDHYHFYLKDGIVGFHKTIQEPDKPDKPKKIHLTCNFENGKIFNDYDSFKDTICRNPGGIMKNVFIEENDLYYIYQIISRPFLQNQKAGKKITRRRRTRQRRRTRKSHYHYR